MTFPIGEYLIFGLGLFILGERSSQRSTRFWGGIWLAWLTGRLLEGFLAWNVPWHWHFSRLFVMVYFWGLAWQHAEKRKILPALITALALAGQNLFVVNEPGMFQGDQWFFGGIVLLIAFLTTQNFWEMVLALIGGILLDIGISVFLFQGIVRHYDLPDPFYWNLCVIYLASVGGARSLLKLWHVKENLK